MIMQSKVQLHLKATQSTDDEHGTMWVSPNQNIRKTSYKQKANVLKISAWKYKSATTGLIFQIFQKVSTPSKIPL